MSSVAMGYQSLMSRKLAQQNRNFMQASMGLAWGNGERDILVDVTDE